MDQRDKPDDDEQWDIVNEAISKVSAYEVQPLTVVCAICGKLVSDVGQ